MYALSYHLLLLLLLLHYDTFHFLSDDYVCFKSKWTLILRKDLMLQFVTWLCQHLLFADIYFLYLWDLTAITILSHTFISFSYDFHLATPIPFLSHHTR